MRPLYYKKNSLLIDIPVSPQARRDFLLCDHFCSNLPWRFYYIYGMRNFILFVLLIFFCGCKQSPIKQSFSTADSLVIHFKDEQAGAVTKTVQTTESNAMNRMIDFIDAKETEQFKCGYDGKMFFYHEGQKIQEVDFKMKDDSCNHFSFLLNGKIMSTKINSEAVDFLDALEKGMPYY